MVDIWHEKRNDRILQAYSEVDSAVIERHLGRIEGFWILIEFREHLARLCARAALAVVVRLAVSLLTFAEVFEELDACIPNLLRLLAFLTNRKTAPRVLCLGILTNLSVTRSAPCATLSRLILKTVVHGRSSSGYSFGYSFTRFEAKTSKHRRTRTTDFLGNLTYVDQWGQGKKG